MNKNESAELNRRDFLKGGSFATLMTMLGGVELIIPAPVQAAELETLVPFQVKCAVIGLGTWGREIIATLSRRNRRNASTNGLRPWIAFGSSTTSTISIAAVMGPPGLD